jgi:hypothetical protein
VTQEEIIKVVEAQGYVPLIVFDTERPTHIIIGNRRVSYGVIAGMTPNALTDWIQAARATKALGSVGMTYRMGYGARERVKEEAAPHPVQEAKFALRATPEQRARNAALWQAERYRLRNQR